MKHWTELRLLRPSDRGVVEFSTGGPIRFKKHPRPLLVVSEGTKRARYVWWVPFRSKVSEKDLETLAKMLSGECVVEDGLDEGPEKWV